MPTPGWDKVEVEINTHQGMDRMTKYFNEKEMARKKKSLWHKIQKSKHYKELKKRFKSFLWRSGWAFAIGTVGVALGYLQGLESEEVVVTILVLCLGEVSKYLNKKAK